MQDNLFFQPIVSSYTKPRNPRFIRRDTLAKKIRDAIDQENCRFVLLTGAPGTGKSTFMAQLAEENPNWLRYFIRRDQRSPLGDPGSRSFLMQMGFQFAALHPDVFKLDQIRVSVETIVRRVESSGSLVSARIGRILASPFVQMVLEVRTQVEEAGGRVCGLEVGEWVSDPRLLSPNDLAKLALFDTARALQEKNGEHLVILVDALDELRYHPHLDSLLDWLEKCGDIPENVRFILSSRGDPALLGGFCRTQNHWLHEISLDQYEDAEKEVRAYATLLASEEPIKLRLGTRSYDFIEQAATKAHNHMGYMDALARAMDQALRQNDETRLQELLELRGLPETLSRLYVHFLDQVRRSVEHEVVELDPLPSGEQRYLRAWPAVFKKMLAVLSVVKQPLEMNQLVALGDIHARDDYVQDCLLRLLQFLDTPPGRYRIYHTSLAEFFGQESLQLEETSIALYVNTTTWHRRISDYTDYTLRVTGGNVTITV